MLTLKLKKKKKKTLKAKHRTQHKAIETQDKSIIEDLSILKNLLKAVGFVKFRSQQKSLY